jgi:hypothetical protein
MQFIQQTKELNEQLNEYKASFKSCSNNNDDDNAELDKSTYDNDNDDDDNADIDTDDVKTANQNLTLNTLNQINELKKNHGDLSQAFGLDLEPDLDDITTSNSQSQIQLIPVGNMQNIKDFCGSQELNLIVKKKKRSLIRDDNHQQSSADSLTDDRLANTFFLTSENSCIGNSTTSSSSISSVSHEFNKVNSSSQSSIILQTVATIQHRLLTLKIATTIRAL